MLPKETEWVGTPPIKCQGIKTKLVPFILQSIAWDGRGRWVEPFMGSGVVAFNLAPERALLCDTNEHIIALYRSLCEGSLTPPMVRERLAQEGEQLLREGEAHYYRVRERFNAEQEPLDFLFLNRSCFNGLMRFNRKGHYNVPFCRKPERFSKAYITKIVHQAEWIVKQAQGKEWEFRCQSWGVTLQEAKAEDFVYLDPPYIGRNAEYFNAWGENDAASLAEATQALAGGYAASMWMENRYRRNPHVEACWPQALQRLHSHFYHLGATEALRNAMEEVLLIKPGSLAQPPSPVP